MKILVAVFSSHAAWTIPRSAIDRLRRQFPQHAFIDAWDRDGLRRGLGEVDAALAAYIPADLIPSLTRLRWVQIPAAGIAHVLSPELAASDIAVTSARGIRAPAIAEHVMAVTLALARRLPLALERQRERRWALDEIETIAGARTLAGRQMGIVGLGSIGTHVARLARAFGMRVAATRRHFDRRTLHDVPDSAPTLSMSRSEEGETGIELLPADRLPELLRTSDVTVLTAASRPDDPPIVDATALAAVKPGSFFVNVSRGRLVDETALLAVLSDGRLAGAALDVFHDEPLDPASPFWSLPSVIVTPHVAGAMEDYWTPLVDLFADNLRRFEAGQPLRNVVDKREGY